MRRILTILFLSLLFFSCKELSLTKTDTLLSLSTNEIVVYADSLMKQVRVFSNKDYTFDVESDWLKATSSDKIISIKISENKTGEPREATISVRTNDSKRTEHIKIVQKETYQVSIANRELVVEAQEATYKISVESSLNYGVSSNVAWLTLTKEADGISVLVAENKAREERVAKVSVKVGSNEVSSILITQKEAISIIPSSGTMNISSSAAVHTLELSTNREYVISPESEYAWLKILSSESDKITFSVLDNNTGEERKAVLNFMVGDKLITSVEVIQKPSISIFSPFMEFGKETADVKAFEETREETTLTADTNLSDTGTLLTYSVKSNAIFNELRYLINLKGFQKASLFVKSKIISEEDKASFEALLLANGYKKISELGFRTTLSESPMLKFKFVNEELQVKVEFFADEKANHYSFTYYPVQHTTLTTFKTLASFTKWQSEQEMRAFEESHGGTYSADKSNESYMSKGIEKSRLVYEVSNGEDGLIAREYYIYKTGANKGISQTCYYYTNPNLAFFGGLDGEYYPSNEFKELASAHGFIFYKKIGDSYVFKNDDIRLSIKWVKDKKFGWVVVLSLY